MNFRITGLDPAGFRHLYGRTDAELAALGVERTIVTAKPGFPDRIGVRDLEPGDTALLLNYTHQPADTPYRASHAIFIQEGATERYDAVDTVPDALRIRPLSVRAFDAHGRMLDADLTPGTEVEALIARLFTEPRAAYLHAHYAKRGCYAARIDRH